MQSIDTGYVLGCARRYGRSIASEELDEQTAFVRAYVQLIREIFTRAKLLASAGGPGDYLDELGHYIAMASALLEFARTRRRTVDQECVYREILSRFGTL